MAKKFSIKASCYIYYYKFHLLQ